MILFLEHFFLFNLLPSNLALISDLFLFASLTYLKHRLDYKNGPFPESFSLFSSFQELTVHISSFKNNANVWI